MSALERLERLVTWQPPYTRTLRRRTRLALSTIALFLAPGAVAALHTGSLLPPLLWAGALLAFAVPAGLLVGTLIVVFVAARYIVRRLTRNGAAASDTEPAPADTSVPDPSANDGDHCDGVPVA